MNTKYDGDQLVDAYLEYLAKAAEPLPAERRTELVAEVTAHIAEARAAGATSPEEVREVLQRLGDPDDIVAASTDGLVQVELPPRLGVKEFGSLVLLWVGPVMLAIGWLVGVWLLWTSDRWTRVEKVLGTLAWPIAYAAAMVVDTALLPPIWVSIVVANLSVLAVLVLLAKNGRAGRSSAARSAASTNPVASGNS